MHIDGVRRHRVLSLAKCLEELYAARQKLLLELKDLDARIRAIQLEHDTLHNLNAPISNLPDELLAMVFEADAELEADSLSLKDTSFKRYIPDPYHPPTHFGDLASHVSRRWRSIALTTPRLWINIECTRVGDTVSSIGGAQKIAWLERKGWRERATNHLRRSGSSPVNIYIRSLRVEDYTVEFLRLISDHIGHCRQLLILEIPEAAVPLLLASLSRPAPLLSYFGASSEVALDFKGPNFFPFGAPCLATADLHDIVLPSLHPAFASVTSLRLTDIHIGLHHENYESLRDGLMGLNSLNHLEIQLGSWYRLDPGNDIMLPTLQFLHVDVTDDSVHFINHFLQSIHAPSLISLSLNGWFPEDPFMGLRFPALQHLILLDVIMDEDDLDELARQFPDINRLTSQAVRDDCCSLDTILLVVLGRRIDQDEEDGESNTPPWSNLQTIAEANSFIPLDTALVGLVSQLKHTSHPICRLLLSNTPDDDEGKAIVDQLRELVEIEDFTEDWPTPFEPGR